ncbi:hypothetical protein [Streptomyces sp. NPDC059003]|uniref:hypothetical protein n=1 Tax=Streptomyces sp. NPDC059003 TaxID=3346691 RepID=UPI00369FF0CC
MQPHPASTYSLYAERDGIAYSWDGIADNLPDLVSTRAQLEEIRHELDTLNTASGASLTCYIHLLEHPDSRGDCGCLEDAQPGDQCRILDTFAPEPGATAAQDLAAAVRWLTGYCQDHGITAENLSNAIHGAAAAQEARATDAGADAQLEYLLRQFGQRQTMDLLTAAPATAQED